MVTGVLGWLQQCPMACGEWAYEGDETFTRPNPPGQEDGECPDRARKGSVPDLVKGKSVEDGTVAAGTNHRI